MLTVALLGASAICAIGPALLFCLNLRRYRPPLAAAPGTLYPVSVLIPARNEEANIGAALRCVLASRHTELEALVLDDDSTDGTAEIVRAIAATDARVRLVSGTGLPPGWNGKQHACWTLANASTHGLLAFLDADVRIEPDLLARMAAFREGTGTGLVSGFPRLITVTWLERLLLPLIHFILLGFLPMGAMRRGTRPSAAAGCGQFLLVERDAYFHSGGHNLIRETMHDGLLLPRVLRRAGYHTDLADITRLASVRMYDSAPRVWQGLAKNATEGIATVPKIVPLSLILLLGQVVPALVSLALLSVGAFLLALHLMGPTAASSLLQHSSGSLLLSPYIAAHGGFIFRVSSPRLLGVLLALSIASLIGSYLPRLLAVRRFQQPLDSALLQPLGVFVLLCVQWYALGRKLFGKPVGWRQRSYSSETGAEVG